jgi:hypothetical protein
MGLPSRYVGCVLRGGAAESPPVPASGGGAGAAESPPIVPASGGGVGAAQSPPIVSASGGMGAPLAVPVAAVAQSVAVSVSTQTVPISALVMAHRYSSTGCTLEADSRDSWDALVAQLRTETWTSARAGEARQMLAALGLQSHTFAKPPSPSRVLFLFWQFAADAWVLGSTYSLYTPVRVRR